MTPIELAANISVKLDSDERIVDIIHGATTTGSEQLRVVAADGSVFHVTITKARR